ncbi:hypothetical protein [Mycolicibacterium sphagni]|uniref:GNAT family N-acetyltransferase n=1 Tax=Mycolicibacterium sphagni TaxID=1786 RepID=A0A255DKK1_9MYCO|nr:hypothetical protein [Mycolicibacterium sphagni]OYN76153.1 hypothetical protein CG716_22635 [Mycolicibacterium sphagni]
MDSGPDIPRAPAHASYELDQHELDHLTRSLIAAYPLAVPADTQPYVCYRVDGGSRFANIGRHIEREVFDEHFGNDSAVMNREYGPYDVPGASTFFISVDRAKGAPTGVMRMIQNNAAGFKTLNDLSDPRKSSQTIASEQIFSYYGITDPATCWDGATIAVRKIYRGTGKYVGIMRYLTRSSYLYGMENGLHHVFTILDKRFKDQATKYLGIPYTPLAGLEAMEYLGSQQSYPMYCYYPEFADRMSGLRMLTPRRLAARRAIQSLKDDSEDEFLRVGE